MKWILRTWRVLPACLALAMCSTGWAQFFNLGSSNLVTGLSSDGSVGAGTSDASGEYFTWTASGGIDLIGGQIAGGGVGGQAKISDDGTRVSGTDFNASSNQFEMSYYDTGTSSWNNLGGIGNFCTGGPGDEASSGWGISGDGTSVVGLGWASFCTDAHAIQWNESSGVTSDLGSTVVDRASRANGTNGDGTIVVGWQDRSDGFRQGAVWDNGVQTVLSIGPDPVSEAQDVTSDGIWVVGNGAADAQAWRWSSADGVLELGTIGVGRGFATGISDDASVIVGFERGFFGGQAGFIWTEGMGMQPIDAFVDALGIDRGGLSLILPLSISGDGKTIGGGGSVVFGFEGFVLTVPEPTAASLLLTTVVAAMALRRRRK